MTTPRLLVLGELAKRTLIVIACVSLALLLGISVQNYHRGRENHALLSIVTSCTTPGQPCYDKAQENTGAAVAQINHVIELAAACAVGQTGSVSHIVAAIETCVHDELVREQPNTGPNEGP